MKTPITRILLCSCLAGTGCAATYDRTEIVEVSSSELPGQVSTTRVSIAVGGLVTAKITPYNSDHNAMISDVTSENATVLGIEHVHDKSTWNRFAFLGVKQGHTRVELRADGDVVGIIEADVTPQ